MTWTAKLCMLAALASHGRIDPLMAIPYLACMALVANLYQLPPRVLPSIQVVEGGRVGTVSVNADRSEDLGVMQVNTFWLRPLGRYIGVSTNIVRDRLIREPCFNIAAAGAILRTYLNEERGDLMRAVGDYHSHTEVRNISYQSKVLAAATRLFVRYRSLHQE
jgi:Transglycosylase SLT domain